VTDAPDASRGPGPSGSAPSGGPRASDDDRNRFVELLERHFAEGRLTDDEFSERMDRALRARSLEELYALVADLPDLLAFDIPRSSPRRRAWRFWR